VNFIFVKLNIFIKKTMLERNVLYFFKINKSTILKKILYLYRKKDSNMNTRYKFNVDKLEITYTCYEEIREFLAGIKEEHICGQDNDVRIMRTASTTYLHTFAVYCSSMYVGQLFFDTPNPNRPHIYMAVDNEILYTCVAGLSYIEQALHLSYFRISKLDICLDTNVNVINRFYRLLKDESKTLIINNKVIYDRYAIVNKLIHYSTGSLKNFRRNKSFILKGNEIELIAYNKQQEIDNISKKEYIKENLQMDKKIYRLEVRFANFKQIHKALKMSYVDINDLYYYPFDDLLEQIFVNTLNRIIRFNNNKCILNYLLKIE
jgi:hypothetical protein